jgi:hypothetical protein
VHADIVHKSTSVLLLTFNKYNFYTCALKNISRSIATISTSTTTTTTTTKKIGRTESVAKNIKRMLGIRLKKSAYAQSMPLIFAFF